MMTAFVPIPPLQAAAMLQPMAPGDTARTILSDYVSAGPIKAYARLISIVHADGREEEVRDKRIDRKLWKRIATAGQLNAIFSTGSVRLSAGTEPAVDITGIRFNKGNVQTVLEQHGSGASPTLEPPPAETKLAKPDAVPPVDTQSAAPPAVSEAKTNPSKDRPRDRPSRGILPGQVTASVNEACVALGIGKTTLYKKFEDGSLPRSKIGGRTVIPVIGLYRLLGISPDHAG